MGGILFRHIVSFSGLKVSEYSPYIKKLPGKCLFFFFFLIEEYGFTVAQKLTIVYWSHYSVNATLACSLSFTAFPDVSVLFLVMSFKISDKTE